MRESSANRRAAVGPELLLDLSQQPGRTLRERLGSALKDAIRGGRLPPGTGLPSSRALADDLGVSRGVVVDVFAQLGAEGFLLTRPGARSVVATAAGRRPATEDSEAASSATVQDSPRSIDLRPGPPDLAAFPRAAWMAATREVLRSLPDRELGYTAPWGTSTLRLALADYLARVRGAMVEQPEIVIVNGATQGVTLLVRVLRQLGMDALAVESPSNGAQRTVLSRYGLRLVDIPVDEEGLDVAALRSTNVRAVLVTPAHQYPSGVLLSPARRRELIRWARDVDGFVLEDDYDSEFRYERMLVGCLQGLDPDRVVLVGSVSKSLAPALRLGWVVAPPTLRSPLKAAKRDDDFGTSGLQQHVLARLISGGTYDAHLRRLRRRYRARREALTSALSAEFPDWPVSAEQAGLHVLLRPPAATDEEQLVTAAAAQGVFVQGIRAMYGTLPPVPGLMLGFARAPVGLLEEAVHRLATAAAAADGKKPARPATQEHVVIPPATAVDYFTDAL